MVLYRSLPCRRVPCSITWFVSQFHQEMNIASFFSCYEVHKLLSRDFALLAVLLEDGNFFSFEGQIDEHLR